MKNLTAKSLIQLLMFVAALFAFNGCASTHKAESGAEHAHAEGKHECEACKKGKAGETTWCDHCKAGFVKGEKVTCESCFKGKSGETTWCDKCKAGYVAGEKVTCEPCFKSKSTGAGPCPEHATGG